MRSIAAPAAVAAHDLEGAVVVAGALQVDGLAELGDLLDRQLLDAVEAPQLSGVGQRSTQRLHQPGNSDRAAVYGVRYCSLPVKQVAALPSLGILERRQHGLQLLNRLERLRDPLGGRIAGVQQPVREEADQQHRDEGEHEARERARRQGRERSAAEERSRTLSQRRIPVGNRCESTGMGRWRRTALGP
jgi:hypothetical protein